MLLREKSLINMTSYTWPWRVCYF